MMPYTKSPKQQINFVSSICLLSKIQTRKQTALKRGQTDCISLTHDHDLWPSIPGSHGHDLLTCKRSRWSKVNPFKKSISLTYDLDFQFPATYGHDLHEKVQVQWSVGSEDSGNKRMEAIVLPPSLMRLVNKQTDRGDCITRHASAVGNNSSLVLIRVIASPSLAVSQYVTWLCSKSQSLVLWSSFLSEYTIAIQQYHSWH